MANRFQPSFSVLPPAAEEGCDNSEDTRKEDNEEEQEERVDMLIRELQKLIPNSTIQDVDIILDQAIEYMKFLQSKYRAQVEMRAWVTGMAFPTAELQHMQQPVGLPTSHETFVGSGSQALSNCYSNVPVLSTRASMQPTFQADAALSQHLTEFPPHPPYIMQYGVPGMPQQFHLAAGNNPTWPHNVQSPSPANQEKN